MHWQAIETTPIRIGARVPSARADAIRDALLKRAVPLSCVDQGRLQPLATAGLLRDGHRVGLVTAAHIFERMHWGDLAVPLPRDRRIARLHSARVRLVMHPDNDVAILWIGERSLAERLCANWEASSTSCLPITGSTPSTYVLVGYPACNARRVDGCVYTKPLVLFTEVDRCRALSLCAHRRAHGRRNDLDTGAGRCIRRDAVANQRRRR